jgi:hypothetical protein
MRCTGDKNKDWPFACQELLNKPKEFKQNLKWLVKSQLDGTLNLSGE